MLQPRDYQLASINALSSYLKSALTHGAQRAFDLETGRPYRPVKDLEDLPYVCLRVPTGGGKTLMASLSLGIVAHDYLHTQRAVCLWLVPKTAILEQTIKALR